ncbi:FAD-dependent oxidoreductase [Bacteroides finegoldii]|jgi:hypothetical protein|uniref:FAD-dependent oxidoreductase n=1 Tax=Bacteroides finegoldii TaxID=338188 RepID=UPI00189F3150|nr:FAD-dependent oxidoreductase [Bacteroides finegoldii]
MDRRKFVKNIGILGGVILSGLPLSEALAKEKGDGKTAKGTSEVDWDVIVIGGGAAGCAAAIAAAREGVRTLLVEAAGMLGGIATAGLLSEWIPTPVQGDFSYSGIAGKVFRTTCEGLASKLQNRMYNTPIPTEILKSTYERLVDKAGVEIWLNSRAIEVNMHSAGRIESLTVASISGITVCRGKVFIDCTGSAEIAGRAGVSFQKMGREAVWENPGFNFRVGNVDYYTYTYQFNAQRKANEKVIEELVQSGKYPLLKKSHFRYSLTNPSVVTFKLDDVLDKLEGEDVRSISKALVQGRSIAIQMLQALQEYFPETFASAVLLDSATQLYVPSRRIIGKYILTGEDLKNRRGFSDEVGRNGYIVGTMYAYEKGDSHGIPYGALISKEVENLLVAGSGISVDMESYETLSTIPVCLVTGEAAGMAAGLVAKMQKTDVNSIDIAMLRDGLQRESRNI